MKRRAILCVDNEAILLLALKQELRNHFGSAFAYETALCAEEGLEIVDELCAEGTTLALIISDWLMPGMRGDEFLQEIHRRFPEARLILLTGQVDEDAIQRAIAKAGLHACVRKPWTSAQLLGAVQGLLEEDSGS